jgi:hypothetical protein
VPRVIQSAKRTRIKLQEPGGGGRSLAGTPELGRIHQRRALPEQTSALLAYLAVAVNHSLTG